MLAVVGRRRRVALALGQRLDGAAERRPRLVEDDLVAGVGQLERRGEAGEPAADDGDPPRRADGSKPPVEASSLMCHTPGARHL